MRRAGPGLPMQPGPYLLPSGLAEAPVQCWYPGGMVPHRSRFPLPPPIQPTALLLQDLPKQDLEDLLEFYQDFLRAWSLVATSRSPDMVIQGPGLLAELLLKAPQLVVPETEVP